MVQRLYAMSQEILPSPVENHQSPGNVPLDQGGFFSALKV